MNNGINEELEHFLYNFNIDFFRIDNNVVNTCVCVCGGGDLYSMSKAL